MNKKSMFSIIVFFLLFFLFPISAVWGVGEETGQQWYWQSYAADTFYMANDGYLDNLLERAYVSERVNFTSAEIDQLGFGGTFFTEGKALKFFGQFDSSECYILTFLTPDPYLIDSTIIVDCIVMEDFRLMVDAAQNVDNQS